MLDSYSFMSLVKNARESIADDAPEKEAQELDQDAIDELIKQCRISQERVEARAGTRHPKKETATAAYPLKYLMFIPYHANERTDVLKLDNGNEYLKKLENPVVPFAALEQAIPEQFTPGPVYDMYEGNLANQIAGSWIRIKLSEDLPDFSGAILERTDKGWYPEFKLQWKWKNILYTAIQEMLQGRSFSVTYRNMDQKSAKVRLSAAIEENGPVLSIQFA